jgi:predicted esterase
MSLVCLLVFSSASFAQDALPPIPPIARVLPPVGLELPQEEREKLESRLADIEQRARAADLTNALPRAITEADKSKKLLHADIEIFTKAVRFAIDLKEFYDLRKDIPKAHKLLDEAERRLKLVTNKRHITPEWPPVSGLTVRGYRSVIDHSAQPYGIVFPENYDPAKQPKIPVYVWLHGRGDKATDLHFIHERLTSIGQLGKVNAIVIHPFGRQCVGFKSAGEKDVISALQHFRQEYKEYRGIEVARERTVLIGFSMGGAGAWHIGAHYPQLFAAVAPGAGFAETAQYTKTDPATVPWYERKLWGMYDVPCYTRNLFNLPVIAYSGENDKQIQAARVMEAAFIAEGRELTHLIGPGVEHKYEPKTLEELKRRLEEIVTRKPELPEAQKYYIQARKLEYASYGNAAGFHARVEAMETKWDDCRLEIEVLSRETGEIRITSKNVRRFMVDYRHMKKLIVDGQDVLVTNHFSFPEKIAGKWKFKNPIYTLAGDPGPIDDAFMREFVVVAPTGKSKNQLVQRWVDSEMKHFIDRWRGLMRGDVRVINDTEIDENAIGPTNLVCFGDPDSNIVIRRHHERLPIKWQEEKIIAGPNSYSASSHLPALIYPLSDDPKKYRGSIVINSGLTFREAHDKTNSQQNPKLPDWAVIDLTQLPDDKSPGKIVDAGFFDEAWQWQPAAKE